MSFYALPLTAQFTTCSALQRQTAILVLCFLAQPTFLQQSYRLFAGFGQPSSTSWSEVASTFVMTVTRTCWSEWFPCGTFGNFRNCFTSLYFYWYFHFTVIWRRILIGVWWPFSLRFLSGRWWWPRAISVAPRNPGTSRKRCVSWGWCFQLCARLTGCRVPLQVVELVVSEFFQQGDLERQELHLQPSVRDTPNFRCSQSVCRCTRIKCPLAGMSPGDISTQLAWDEMSPSGMECMGWVERQADRQSTCHSVSLSVSWSVGWSSGRGRSVDLSVRLSFCRSVYRLVCLSVGRPAGMSVGRSVVKASSALTVRSSLQDIFDRHKVDKLPRMQVQFFKSTGIPVFEVRELLTWKYNCEKALYFWPETEWRIVVSSQNRSECGANFKFPL